MSEITSKFANRCGHSDIEPFEIVRVHGPKRIEIRRMEYKQDPTWQPNIVPGGFCGHCTNQSEQRWIITANPENPTHMIRLHRDGVWRDIGRSRFTLSDHPRRFYDYNF